MDDSNQHFSPADVQLFAECSWEVCNKIGGIYTVLSTKAVELTKLFGDKLLFIGPDHGQGADKGKSALFKERKTLFKQFASKKLLWDIKVRTGRWNIPGSPAVILVDFKPAFAHLNDIYGEMWNHFGVDSLHAYGDYDESCAFSVASAIVMMELISHLKADPAKCMAHFNEWTTGMGLLYLKLNSPEVATLFTTHATTIGRSICGNGKPLYQYFHNYNGDQMAAELNVESKHSLEKAAAFNADCFTTVSHVTARECEQLLGKKPDVVTPNGFEPSFVPSSTEWEKLRKQGRKKLLHIASLLWDTELNEDTLLVGTSGRNEFRNKGLDLFLESMARLAEKLKGTDRKAVGLVMVPAWVKQPSGDLLVDMEFKGWIKPDPDYLTHRLNNEDSDAIACSIRRLSHLMKERGIDDKVKLVFIPSYLDCNDGIINISYYDLLPAVDITVFGSYYEPWGYTPLESIAFGVPTVTTDKAGFGQWAIGTGNASLAGSGVAVVNREDTNFNGNVEEISEILKNFIGFSDVEKALIRKNAFSTASKAGWKEFIRYYGEAFDIAERNRNDRTQKQ